MSHSQSLALICACGIIAACAPASSDSGVAGSGPTLRVVGITPDSLGYTVAVQVTNADTSPVWIGSGCRFVSALAADGSWLPASAAGPCAAGSFQLPAGGSITLSQDRAALAPGQLVRASVSWGYPQGRLDHVSTSTSAPAPN